MLQHTRNTCSRNRNGHFKIDHFEHQVKRFTVNETKLFSVIKHKKVCSRVIIVKEVEVGGPDSEMLKRPIQETSVGVEKDQSATTKTDKWTVQQAVSWGIRNGMDTQQLHELSEFATLVKSVELPSDLLRGGTVLDNGSFGTIVKTTFEGAPVAVKCFLQVICTPLQRRAVVPCLTRVPIAQDGKKSMAQYLREANLELSVLCSTKHPHIVKFLGAPACLPTETDNQPLLFGMVFEFCAGGSLFSFLHEKKAQITRWEKIRLAKELASALEYLHSETIIHRDLSSRNILLTNELKVKLADFGCARNIPAGTYQPTTISGSPPWMAPEQLGGLPLSFSADVWSLGVILWELLTELVPWNEVSNELWVLRQLVFDEGRHLPTPDMSNFAAPEERDAATIITMILQSTFQRSPHSRAPVATILAGLQAICDKRAKVRTIQHSNAHSFARTRHTQPDK